MRKPMIFIFAILLLFLFGAEKSLFAQSGNTKRRYTVPAQLKLKNNVANEDPRSAGFSELLIEKIYPVGWSKNGKFAFYVEPPDEACGCYFGDLYIQDLRTDKILWSNIYKGDFDSDNETIETHWRKNQKLFDRKLAEYGIIQAKNFTLAGLPLKTADDTIKVDFSSDVEMVTEPLYFDSKGSVSLKLISEKKGTKTLYQKTYPEKKQVEVMSVALGGVLVSPHQPQAAIILVETYRGWEGPPNITNLKVIGASLTNSFQTDEKRVPR